MRKSDWALVLSAVGLLFSGGLYLSTLLAGKCTGGCIQWLGYPTCLYGFLLFTGTFLSALAMRRWQAARGAARAFALAGLLFSLVFGAIELSQSVFGWLLGLPNCIYGLVMFAAVLYLLFGD